MSWTKPSHPLWSAQDIRVAVRIVKLNHGGTEGGCRVPVMESLLLQKIVPFSAQIPFLKYGRGLAFWLNTRGYAAAGGSGEVRV